MIRLILLYFICFFSFMNTAFCDQSPPLIKIETRVSKSIIHIGETITFELNVIANQDVKIKYPEFGVQLSQFSIKEFSSLKQETIHDQIKYSQSFTLNTFITGDFIIPPLIIEATIDEQQKSYQSSATYVRVDSLLNTEETDIRDTLTPYAQTVMPKWLVWTLWITIPIVIIALIIFLIHFILRKKEISETKNIPPWEQAMLELEELKDQNLIAQNLFKEFYFELSSILRTYIENRFHLKAPESTTEEFIKLMQNVQDFNSNQKQLLKDFLKQADLIKFAKLEPQTNEADNALQTVKEFIHETQIKDNDPESEADS